MIKVLYVDDEPSLLEIAKEFLESEGDVKVETSESAMDALVRIETRPFDAIICDYQMPVVDGIKFLKTVRMQGRNTPFILFTGKGREEVAIEALNNGADFYLQKGGNPQAQFTELLNMIRRSIDQRQSAERLKESEEIYEKLFKDNVETMVLFEPKSGAIADVNAAAAAFFGYTREEMLRLNIADIHPGKGKEVLPLLDQMKVGRGKIMMSNLLASGEVREVEVDSGMLRVKGRPLGYAIIHDITEARRAQRREQRLTRALKVLSAASHLVLRSKGEMELLDGICQALVLHGDYMGAWVGCLDLPDGGVREVARASRSNEATDLGGFPLSTGDLMDLSSQVREFADVIVRKNEDPKPRTGLSKDGSARALAAIPLKMGGEVKAVMVVASDDVEAMEANETLLLQELAESLSEAISLIDERDKEKTALERRAALADEQSVLRNLIDASSAAIIVFDCDGKVNFTTSNVRETFGIEGNDVLGTAYNSSVWRMSSIDGRLLADEELPYSLAKRSGEPLLDLRFAIEPSTGSRRFLSLDAVPVKGKDGALSGVAVLAKDITERYPKEDRSQGDALMRELMASALDVVVKIDRDGRLVYVSPAVRNLLGKEPEELIGKDVGDHIHPDDLEPMFQAIQGRFGNDDQLTLRFRLRRGEDYIVVEAIGRVLVDEHGEPTSLIGSVRDITSRQMAEDKLWETGSKLRAIIQTSPMAIISLDPNGVINTWNPAAERVFGWGDIDSGRPFPFLPQEDTEELRRMRQSILAGAALSDVEINRKLEGQGERRISISTAPILDQSGKVISIILVASDITERKAMEDRLIQLNDLLRLVNRILRHDTLNELMVVAGSLDMFQKSKQERFLATATKAVNRSVELIKRMKELESLAASGGAMKIYDLRQTVDKVLRGYMVDFSVDGEGWIYADDALPSAIDNVVRNAMVHGRADRIEARIWVRDGSCYLRIADNGIGIPDQVKERLFDEGFSYGANAGTGLGLYLVTRALARYGGSVSVEDNQPKGAAFIMTFPEARGGTS